MAWPVGLPLGTISFGAAAVMQSGINLPMRVTIDVVLASTAPSKVLVYRPTGSPLPGVTTLFKSDEDADGVATSDEVSSEHSLTLPLCDTEDMGYGNGMAIVLDGTHQYTHVYRAKIEYLTPDLSSVYSSLTTTKDFVLTSDSPSGDIDDLLLIPDSGASFGVPVYIPDSGATAMADHLAEADPHPQYLLPAELPLGTTSVAGIWEGATTPETLTGIATDRVVSPAGLKAVIDALKGTAGGAWDTLGEIQALVEAGDSEAAALAALVGEIHDKAVMTMDPPVTSGSDHTQLNAAMASLSAFGGGTLLLEDEYTTNGPTLIPDNVLLLTLGGKGAIHVTDTTDGNPGIGGTKAGTSFTGTIAAGSPNLSSAGAVFTADMKGCFVKVPNASGINISAGTVDGTAAAVNIVTGGNLVVKIDGGSNQTIALSAADTPATVVTKINAVLGATGTASLVSGVLRIVSGTSGFQSTATVVSGTGSVLSNLKVTAGLSGTGVSLDLNAKIITVTDSTHVVLDRNAGFTRTGQTGCMVAYGNVNIGIKGVRVYGDNVTGAPSGSDTAPNGAVHPKVNLITLSYAKGLVIEDCEIDHGWSMAMQLKGCCNVSVHHNYIHEIGRDGIDIAQNIDPGHHISVTDNTVRNAGDDKIIVGWGSANDQTYGRTTSVVVTGNNLSGDQTASTYDLGRGIVIAGCYVFNVSGNTITDTSGPGIWCREMTGGAAGTTSHNYDPSTGGAWKSAVGLISSNTILNAGQNKAVQNAALLADSGPAPCTGIHVTDTTDTTVKGNVIRNSYYTDIWVASSCTRVFADDNDTLDVNGDARDLKELVADCVATSNITLSATQTIDGHAFARGERVLCVGQTNPVENGLWVLSPTSPDTSRAQNLGTTFVRALPLPKGLGIRRKSVKILTGTTYANTTWSLDTSATGSTPVVIGDDAQTWTQDPVLTGATEAVQSSRRRVIAESAGYGVGNWFIQRQAPTALSLWREDLTEPMSYYSWLLSSKYGNPGMPGGTAPLISGSPTPTPYMRMIRRGPIMRAEHVGTGVSAPPTGFTVQSPTDPSQGYPQGVVLRGSMTSGSAVFTVTAGGPLVQGIHRSRKITIPGAGVAGADLVTNFPSNPSGSSATLADAASTTVTDVAVTLWPTHWLSDGTAGRAVTGPAHTCKSLGFVGLRSTNTAGLIKVTVSDGSVANKLPTAQDVVTAGLYPNTILVANGGSLAPTDRVWVPYANKINYGEPICAGIWDTSASRSLTLTMTGYAATGASGGNATKSPVAGWLWADGTETPISVSGSDAFVAEVDLIEFDGSNVMNYSHTGNGAGVTTFVGGQHGYEILESAPTVTVDGTLTTVGQWQVVPVSGNAKIALVSTTRHPNALTTDFWRVRYDYRLTPEGVAVHHVNEFLVANNLTRAYPFMFNVNAAIFDRAQVDKSASALTIATGTDVLVGQGPNTAYAFWKNGGELMAALIVPEARQFTNNWSDNTGTGTGGYIQDRAPENGVRVNKVYVGRTSTPAAGEVWDNRALYVVGRNRAGTALLFPVA